MTLEKAQQAIVNGIYAGIAWLVLDFGLLLQEHGREMLPFLASRPQMVAGAVITLLCIGGLFVKSRLAAVVLFLIFLVPLVLRLVQDALPPAMMLLFFFVLLYFFLAAVLGTFSYHQLKLSARDDAESAGD